MVDRHPDEEGTHPILTSINEALNWEYKYRERIEKIDERYGKTAKTRSKTLSVFWSIIEVMRAATFQRAPELVGVQIQSQRIMIMKLNSAPTIRV